MKLRIIKRPSYNLKITPEEIEKYLVISYEIQLKRWFFPFWIVSHYCSSMEDADYVLKSLIAIKQNKKRNKKMKYEIIKSVKI